jgi:hypothetical protein
MCYIVGDFIPFVLKLLLSLIFLIHLTIYLIEMCTIISHIF